MKILDFRLVSIGEAAQFYGVSVPTMRRWDKIGYGEYRDSDVL